MLLAHWESRSPVNASGEAVNDAGAKSSASRVGKAAMGAARSGRDSRHVPAGYGTTIEQSTLDNGDLRFDVFQDGRKVILEVAPDDVEGALRTVFSPDIVDVILGRKAVSSDGRASLLRDISAQYEAGLNKKPGSSSSRK